MGRPGPVIVEVPSDVAEEDVDPSVLESYRPVKSTATEADPGDVLEAAKALVSAKAPIIHAGLGVLYADGTQELVELAELLQVPVMTTLADKRAFPETHSLALGSGSTVISDPVRHSLGKANRVFGIGTSFTSQDMTTRIPPGKVIIHATVGPIDIGNYYDVDYPIIGDARLVLR